MDTERLLALLFMMFFLSCFGDKDQYSNPEECIISLSAPEDYAKTVGKVSSWQTYLSQTLGVNVKVFKLINAFSIIEVVKMIKSKADIRPIVTTAVVSEDTMCNYWSSLIVANGRIT